MLLSEGKEEQSYQKCQSSKKHIYKIVTEGHKHLNFYTNSPRMVPAHISPQPDKVFLQQETDVPISSHVISKLKKGRLTKSTKNLQGFSSAASELKKNHGYLSRDELNVWTEKYCMSDKDIQLLQQRLHVYTGKREMLSLKTQSESQGI